MRITLIDLWGCSGRSDRSKDYDAAENPAENCTIGFVRGGSNLDSVMGGPRRCMFELLGVNVHSVLLGCRPNLESRVPRYLKKREMFQPSGRCMSGMQVSR